ASFHVIEKGQAPENGNQDHGDRGDQDGTGRGSAARQRPAEAINDARHGVQAIKPAVALRNKLAGIVNGRSEGPELDDKGDQIADVPIQGIESGKPETHAENRKNGEQQEQGNEQQRERRTDAVRQRVNEKHQERDGKIDEAGERGGNREDEAGEIDLGND